MHCRAHAAQPAGRCGASPPGTALQARGIGEEFSTLPGTVTPPWKRRSRVRSCSSAMSRRMVCGVTWNHRGQGLDRDVAFLMHQFDDQVLPRRGVHGRSSFFARRQRMLMGMPERRQYFLLPNIEAGRPGSATGFAIGLPARAMKGFVIACRWIGSPAGFPGVGHHRRRCRLLLLADRHSLTAPRRDRRPPLSHHDPAGAAVSGLAGFKTRRAAFRGLD